MRKLIRDKIAAAILQENTTCGDENCDHSAHPCRNGFKPSKVYPLSNDFEYAKELAIKLSEEFRELIQATSPELILEVSAAALEVLTSICALNGYSLGDLLKAAREKYNRVGGFENRYVLETEK